MTITLTATQFVAGSCASAASVNYTIYGDEVTSAGADDFKVLAQGQLPASPASLYAVPAGEQTIIKAVHLHNTAAGALAVAMHVQGTAAANRVVAMTIPANGSATYDGRWTVYDASGYAQTAGATGPAGSQGIQGVQGVQGNSGAPGVVQGISALDASVIISGTAANPVVGLDADLIALAGVATTTYGRAVLALADSTAETARLDLASITVKGLLSPGDKKIIDNLHYDVVADYGWIGNDSNDNGAGAGGATAFSTIMSGLPTGARLFFPAGTFRTSVELTINVDKRNTFQGGNRYSSIIKTTSATANIFHKSVAGWYDTFIDLGFQSSVTKTAGAAIRISAGNNVGMNVYRCWITGLFKGIEAVGAQSANLSVWSDIDISGIPNGGRGLQIDGSTINVMIHNATINAGAATTSACVEINQSGAVQVTGCDWIQGTNVLLINSTSGAGPQACYFTNCFFDQPQGSVIKVIGTNTANRIKFTQCGIAPTGNNHGIEINGTGAGAVGTATALPAGFSFVDCDIYSQNGTNTGAGIRISGCQDVNIQSCRITGFNGAGGAGIYVTPSASNLTKVRINGNILGPNSNLTVTNETGVKLDAGASALGALSIADNSMLGCGTAISDASTILATATKNIRDNQGAANGLSASAVPGDTYTTTVEKVVMQVYVPANGFKVGTSILGQFSAIPGATTVTEMQIRIGTAGTIADACFVKIVGPATATTPVWATATGIIATIGAAGTLAGSGSIQSNVVGATVTTGGTVNTAVGNFVSITARSGTTNTAAVKGGQLLISGPV